MKFKCPSCKTPYEVPDRDLPATRLFTCRKCRHEIPLGPPAPEAAFSDHADGGTKVLLAGALDLMKQIQAEAAATRPPATHGRPSDEGASPTKRTKPDSAAAKPATPATPLAATARKQTPAAPAAAPPADDEAGSTRVITLAEMAQMQARAAPTAAPTAPPTAAPTDDDEPGSTRVIPLAEMKGLAAAPSSMAADATPVRKPATTGRRGADVPTPASRVERAPEPIDSNTERTNLARGPAVPRDAGSTAAPDLRPMWSRPAFSVGAGGGFIGGLLVGVASTLLFAPGGHRPTAAEATPEVAPAAAAADLAAPGTHGGDAEHAAPGGTSGDAQTAAVPKGGAGKAPAKAKTSARGLGLSDPDSDGCLAVTTVPSANVLLDGFSVATTPVKCIELPSGVQHVTLEVPGTGQRHEAQVTIKAGKVTRLTHDF